LKFGVVLLAAGRSARMGRPKLLLPWGETTVLGHLLHQWRKLGAEQLAIVTAPDDGALVEELARVRFAPGNRVVNPQPERGMFSSIQCAARWTEWRPALSHWAIVLGDQPHLRSSTLRAVLELAGTEPGKVCQPAFGGRTRHPVIVPGPIFKRLRRVRAATLKDFLAKFPSASCAVNDPGLALDIDYPKDYRRALHLWHKAPGK
jgi:molybdenum cofactor cytidylyltransferase